MRYRAGVKFKFRDYWAQQYYPDCIIQCIVPRNGFDEIWFNTSKNRTRNSWISSTTFDDPNNDYYGIIINDHREFTDEEYEELLV